MLPDHDAIKTSATKIKGVTKINTICSVLNDQCIAVFAVTYYPISVRLLLDERGW